MTRTKLELPDQFAFSTDIAVRIGDINYGGHLGNDAVLSLIHEARVRFLSRHGMSERDAGGAGIIMTDVVIVYKSEVFYGSTLKIEVAVQGLTRTGCDFYYRLRDRASGKEVARAKTGIAFFDYETRKVMPVPDRFRTAVFQASQAVRQDSC